MTLCKACKNPVPEKYCSFCGQSAAVGPITLTGLLRDLPHAVFHVHRGFLFNVIQLFKNPGTAIREYIAGRRRPFFHPATFLVLALISNYLVVKITDLHFYDEGELVSMDPLKAKAIRDYDALQWWFLEHTYIYILIAIPFSTLLLYGFLKIGKTRFNIAETAVVVLFTIAQGVLIQTIIYAMLGWVNSGPFIRTVEMCNLAILVMYASFVIYQLLDSASNPFSRFMLALSSGITLALSWIASAYMLYLLLS